MTWEIQDIVIIDRIQHANTYHIVYTGINFQHNFLIQRTPNWTRVTVRSMNMEYDIAISDTTRTRTRNVFRHEREPIPQGHSDGRMDRRLIN